MSLRRWFFGTIRPDAVETESINTDNQTINNSVTYPDGTVVTTSPGGGGYDVLETVTPSGAPSADLTTGIDSTYDYYTVELSNVIPATDANVLYLRMSSDGGSTFINSGYRAGQFKINDTPSSGSRSDGGSEIALTFSSDPVGSETGEPGVSGTVTMTKPADTSIQTQVSFDIVYGLAGADSPTSRVIGSGRDTTARAIDAIRIVFASGNIASGTVTIKGGVK